MSSLILLPLLVLVIPGVILLSLGKSNNPTSVQTKRKLWGGVLLGIAFLFFGVASIIGTKMSPQPEVLGTLTNLRQFDGTRNKSSQFQVVHGSERSPILSCPYNGSSLQEGETVLIRYLDFDHSILHLRVLDGPNTGFTLDIPARPWLGVIPVLISLPSFWIAYMAMRKTLRSSHLQSN